VGPGEEEPHTKPAFLPEPLFGCSLSDQGSAVLCQQTCNRNMIRDKYFSPEECFLYNLSLGKI